MGEAILTRRYSNSSPTITGYEYTTEIIDTSKYWIVPEAKDQQFSVRIFGGGGRSW